jgi:hypothetical protein
VVEDRIVAVALLTQRDLDVLGTGFRRLFVVDEHDSFTSLLEQLNAIDATPGSADRVVEQQA